MAIPDLSPHALASLLGDAALRHTLAQQARRQVQTHFDLDRNVDALAVLLSRSPAPAAHCAPACWTARCSASRCCSSR